MYINDNPQSIHLTKTLKTQANVYKTFYNGYDMHNRSQIILKNENQTWEQAYQATYYQNQQNPFKQTQQK